MILGAALGAATGAVAARRGHKVRGVLVGAAIGAASDLVAGIAINAAVGSPKNPAPWDPDGWAVQTVIGFGPGGL